MLSDGRRWVSRWGRRRVCTPALLPAARPHTQPTHPLPPLATCRAQDGMPSAADFSKSLPQGTKEEAVAVNGVNGVNGHH